MDADAGVYDVYDEKRCLLQQVTGNQRLLLSGNDKRPMLYIRKDKQTFVVKPRALPDTGVVNFRDLGGYVNRDGQQGRYDCFIAVLLCVIYKRNMWNICNSCIYNIFWICVVIWNVKARRTSTYRKRSIIPYRR